MRKRERFSGDKKSGEQTTVITGEFREFRFILEEALVSSGIQSRLGYELLGAGYGLEIINQKRTKKGEQIKFPESPIDEYDILASWSGMVLTRPGMVVDLEGESNGQAA